MEDLILLKRIHHDYFKHSTNELTEEKVKECVEKMYHYEDGKKISGEKFPLEKIADICDKYSVLRNKGVNHLYIYLAVNSHYHDSYCLYRAWFSSNIEDRIIESAITFWFMDDDWCYEDKISTLIK